MNPLAIIIVTCHRPNYLYTCTDTCLRETWFLDTVGPNLHRIFIVDSSDGTYPASCWDEHATIIKHHRPYYALASARNAGLDAALSDGYEWGLFLDDDEWLLPGCLAAHKGAYSGGKTLYRGIVTSALSNGQDAFLGDLLERMPEMITLGSGRAWGLGSDLMQRILRFGGITNTSIDLRLLKEAGGFNEKFDGAWGYEDTELIHRLMVRDGWSIQFVRDAVAYHDAAPAANDSYSRRDFVNNKRLFEKLARQYKEG